MDYSNLIKKAIYQKNNAYCQYSNFHVGAALLCKNGNIYLGSNMENSSYGATLCAERAAFASAVSNGEREFVAIAICGDSNLTYPCGICRQIMVEFNSNMDVIIVTDENTYRVHSAAELLPYHFDKGDLN